MPTLLLTGATGFLGRHIARAAPEGWTVHPLPRAASPWTAASFAQAIEAIRPEAILHAAGSVGTSGRACFEANTILAAELLEAVAKHPTPTILIGSAAEYGHVPPDAQPVQETHPCAPTTPYGIAKYAQTLLATAVAARGLPVLVARLFNPVGPGMPAALALPSFARRIAQAEPGGTIRTGDLSAARDFIHIDEATRLIWALLRSSPWPYPVVNIGSGQAYTLQSLLDGLLHASGKPLSATADPALARPGDMPTLTGSTARLQAMGLTPAKPNFANLLPLLIEEASSPSPLAGEGRGEG